MKQYLNLLRTIEKDGTLKPPAREGMPSTKSLFGHQFRHNLQDGFPLLTTKKITFNHIVTELIWFLKGDINIKYLVDNSVNIWNEDAYNYYKKQRKLVGLDPDVGFTLSEFITHIKEHGTKIHGYPNYNLGDCGNQYGKTWINYQDKVDQIKNLVNNLQNNPQSRRHIVTSIDPVNDSDLALYWCHSMFQFNCRPMTPLERSHYAVNNNLLHRNELMFPSEYEDKSLNEQLDEVNVPKYYLDCQMYQRSADVFLGVPYNIASYALLTHIIAKMCNMVVGDYIHTFGDVHLYENHIDQVKEQLSREEVSLPRLKLDKAFENHLIQWEIGDVWNTDEMISSLDKNWFTIEKYKPHPSIKGKLSTGLR